MDILAVGGTFLGGSGEFEDLFKDLRTVDAGNEGVVVEDKIEDVEAGEKCRLKANDSEDVKPAF